MRLELTFHPGTSGLRSDDELTGVVLAWVLGSKKYYNWSPETECHTRDYQVKYSQIQSRPAQLAKLIIVENM